MLRLIRLAAGFTLIFLGLIGLFLPILQGWLFLGLGTAMLSRDLPIVKRFVDRIRARYPRVFETIGRWKTSLFSLWSKWRKQSERKR